MDDSVSNLTLVATPASATETFCFDEPAYLSEYQPTPGHMYPTHQYHHVASPAPSLTHFPTQQQFVYPQQVPADTTTTPTSTMFPSDRRLFHNLQDDSLPSGNLSFDPMSPIPTEYNNYMNSRSDNSYLTNGDVSAQQSKQWVPCKVCGDKASGYHYGVTSCEGCKGFFRRSIQKQIEYRCLRDGKCMVYRLNRNRCQYCRFKKCLAVGMSRDSVRYGRVPKKTRDRMADESRVSSMSGDMGEHESELEKKQLDLYDVILSVSQAHHANCAYTDDKIKNLNTVPMNFNQSIDPQTATTDMIHLQKISMWETLANHSTPEIQRVVEFAKRIPGFIDLPQEDQLVLIKTGFFEVWLVRMSRMFNPHNSTLVMVDGHQNGFILQHDQLDMLFSPELVAVMFQFSMSFNNLHLSDGEIGLFTAAVLLSRDRTKLSCPQAVEQNQDKIIESLKLQLSRSHSSDPQVFPNLLMKLSELRSVGAKHNEVLTWYRMNWLRLNLPPLFAEIYDIPRDEDTANSMSLNAVPMALPIKYDPGSIKYDPGSIKYEPNTVGLAQSAQQMLPCTTMMPSVYHCATTPQPMMTYGNVQDPPMQHC